jgi:6-phosphogluconolactonase
MKNIGTIKVFPDESSWVQSIVNRFFSILKSISLNNDLICVAVSGGSTPFPVYTAISDAIINDKNLFAIAQKTHVFLVDERYLPLSHPESNGGRLFEVWNQLPFNLYLVNYLPNQNDLLSRYKFKIFETLRCNDQGTPVFDLIVLGMGNDGHTASLFPNTDALTNEDDIAVLYNVDDKYPLRITMTFPLLRAAKHKIVLISGNEKITVLNQMITDKQTNYPIERLMFDDNSNLEWFIK